MFERKKRKEIFYTWEPFLVWGWLSLTPGIINWNDSLKTENSWNEIIKHKRMEELWKPSHHRGVWKCLESCRNRSVTHSQTCHIQDWQVSPVWAGTSHFAVFHLILSNTSQISNPDLCVVCARVCVCVWCSILTPTSGTRAEEGRACLGRKKERRQTCCRDLFLWALGENKPFT